MSALISRKSEESDREKDQRRQKRTKPPCTNIMKGQKIWFTFSNPVKEMWFRSEVYFCLFISYIHHNEVLQKRNRQ